MEFDLQVDPVKELIVKFMGEQEAENRKTLSVDSVPLDESGLRELLVCSNYLHLVSCVNANLPSGIHTGFTNTLKILEFENQKSRS